MQVFYHNSNFYFYPSEKRIKQTVNIHLDYPPSLTRQGDKWKITCTIPSSSVERMINQGLRKIHLASTSIEIRYKRDKSMDQLKNNIDNIDMSD